MKLIRTGSRLLRPLTAVALLGACGAPGDEPLSRNGDESSEEAQFGTSEEALSASCNSADDSNMLAAGLAVAIAKELGRWDVNTDFVVSNGKLALSTTGQLHCGSNCPRITALLALQDDVTSTVPNHVPATYRANLTTWYAQQKTALTNLVAQKLTRTEGVFQIRSNLTGKYIVPAAGSTASGAVLQESDQYTSTTASQWTVKLNGTKRQLVNVKSGLCMDLATDTSGSTNVVQRACSGVHTQDLRLGLLNPGILTIRSDYNMAFIPQGGSASNNTAIVQSTVTGAAQEGWVFAPYGSGTHLDLTETITAVFSLKVASTGYGYAVQSSSTSDGVAVVQQPYDATDDRFHWYVTQVGTYNNNGSVQIQYQFENRRTGKCMDLDGSSPRHIVQKTCSTSQTQRFLMAPTGNLRNVMYAYGGNTVDVQNGSAASGAPLVVGPSGEGWQYYNMVTFDPILAIEPHRLTYSSTAANAALCGNYDWYSITQPNGMALADPASTYVELIFAGGKRTASGSDTNPYIAEQVSGNQVAIDPTYGLDASGTTSTGSCTAACVSVSVSSLVGHCCSCSGVTKAFSKAAWSPTTFLCL
jgi:hypothetical protein